MSGLAAAGRSGRVAGWSSYLLRISPARYALPVLVGAEASVIFGESSSFYTEWRWAMDWAGAGFYVTGPLIAGFSAWRAQAVRADRGEALSPYGIGTRVLYAEAGAVAAWAVIAHLLVVAAVVADCFRAGLRGAPPVGAVGLQCLLLVAVAFLGYLVAQLSDSKLLPPVVAAGAYYALTAASLPGLWFEISGATAQLTGLAYRRDVVGFEVALYLGLIALATSITRRAGAVVWKPVVAVVALSAVVGSAGWLMTTKQVRFELTATKPGDYVCYGREPRVCLRHENALKRGDIQRVLARLERAAGPEASVPGTFVQVTNADVGDVAGRQLFINPDTVTSHGVAADLLVHYLVWNRRCLLGDSAPPVKAQNMLEQLSIILQDRGGVLGAQADLVNDPAVQRFLAWPVKKQDAWIAAALDASDRCAYDELPVEP